jgi:hypothetical protein
MPKLNWNIIAPNIADARKQLEEIEARLKSGNPPKPVEFQIMVQHAYHHLNFAWNARHWSTRRYAHLTDEDFQAGGEQPTDLDFADGTEHP